MIDALFRFLKPYKGVIYNLLVDLAIPFKQLYPLVKDRKWNRYQTAEEINLDNEFIILSQSPNKEEVKRIYANSGIKIKDIRYVPFNEWILHTNDFIENTGEVDLIMGTSFRKGKRTQKYIDYFLRRNDISVELFGSITEKHFKGFTIPNNVTFTPKLKDVSKVIEKNATGYSTVTIGDPNYNNNNIITLRFAESLLANCITFIDNDFDRQHKIYPNLPFMYVKNGDDLERKIKYLKANPKFHKAILKIQHNKVEEIRKNNFPKLLENAILENQIQERNDYKWII